jgi:hypothetical protein
MLGLVVLIVPLQNLLYVSHAVAGTRAFPLLCFLPLFSSR